MPNSHTSTPNITVINVFNCRISQATCLKAVGSKTYKNIGDESGKWGDWGNPVPVIHSLCTGGGVACIIPIC